MRVFHVISSILFCGFLVFGTVIPVQAVEPGTEVSDPARPENLVTVYRPDPEMGIQTEWIEKDDIPPFSALYLDDYETLRQTDNTYDDAYTDFTVLWDESSYAEGIASGAESFFVTGTYGDISPYEEEWKADLYRKGLLRAEGEPAVMVRVHDPDNAIYTNIDNGESGYSDIRQFHIYIRPGTAFGEVVLPSIGSLSLTSGYYNGGKEFGLAFNKKDYEEGIASGLDSFSIRGIYTENPEWKEEDKERFRDGRMRILPGTPSPVLTVSLLGEDLPFEVKMQEREAGLLIPAFTFPWPNGAKSVTWMFSFDKSVWYEGIIEWNAEWERNMTYDAGAYYDEEDKLIGIPKESMFPFYCKLSVEGSAYSGETKVMKVTPDENGNWTMEKDQEGDHGGGGQGVHDRPGKEEAIEEPPEASAEGSPAPAQNKAAYTNTGAGAEQETKTQADIPPEENANTAAARHTKEASTPSDNVQDSPKEGKQTKRSHGMLYVKAAAASMVLILAGAAAGCFILKKK